MRKGHSLLTKIISGDHLRKSRLHDEKGNFAGWGNICRHLAPAAATALLRVAVGYRRQLPWISYSAIRQLRQFLTKESRVLEFGSGMSTIWYAKHAGEVCSVEDYAPWFESVSGIIERQKLANVHYKFAATADEYFSFKSEDSRGFDLIMIDGSWRSKCVAHAKGLLKPGGILYVDNTDKDSAPGGDGDLRVAEALAREFAAERGAQVREFTDFAPAQLFVEQGLLIKLPGEK
jgi:predicted O-methyltransferase YrrM